MGQSTDGEGCPPIGQLAFWHLPNLSCKSSWTAHDDAKPPVEASIPNSSRYFNQ